MINLIPEASSAPPDAKRRYTRRSILLSAVFAALVISTAVIATETEASRSVLAALWAASGAILLALIYEFVVLMRSLDELQIRIHLTALASGFGAASAVVTMGGLAAGFISGEVGDWLILLAAFAMPGGIFGYIFALHLAQRRYR